MTNETLPFLLISFKLGFMLNIFTSNTIPDHLLETTALGYGYNTDFCRNNGAEQTDEYGIIVCIVNEYIYILHIIAYYYTFDD